MLDLRLSQYRIEISLKKEIYIELRLISSTLVDDHFFLGLSI